MTLRNAVEFESGYFLPGSRQRNTPFVLLAAVLLFLASFGLPGESTAFHPACLHELNRTLSQGKREGNNISIFLIASKVADVKVTVKVSRSQPAKKSP